MKTVYAWVADFNEDREGLPPYYKIDLFFSSEEKFLELYAPYCGKKQILSPIEVPDEFNTLDFIPDNY